MPMVPDFAIPEVLPDARLAPLNPDAALPASQAVKGLGQTVQAGAEQTTQTALSIQQLNDENAANDINNNAQKQLNNLLYGPDGFYSKSGKDAVTAYPQVQAAMQQIQQGAKSAAQNPYTQSVVGRTMDYMFNREQNQVGLHFSQETKNWHQDSVLAAADVAANTASLNWNNQTYIDSAFHTADDAAAQVGSINGYSDAQIADLRTELRSKAGSAVLDAAMAKEPVAAMKLYNTMVSNGDLSGPVANNVGARIRRAAMPMDADAGAASAISQWNSQNTTVPVRPVNNPGNLKIPGTNTFAQFATPEKGIEALQHDLLVKNTPTDKGGDGLQTLAQIITKYAPPGDNNNTGAYITDVASRVGVDPNKPIDLTDPLLMAKTVSAIINHEGTMKGHVPTPEDLMAAAPIIMDQNGKAMQAKYPDQPDAYDIGSRAAYTNIVKQKSVYDMQQNAALDTVQNYLSQNKITDPSQLLSAGGDVANAWNSLQPKAQAGVAALIEKNQPGADTSWSPQKQQFYNTLIGMAARDPQAFLKINLYDPNVVNALTPRQWELAKAQQDAAQKGASIGSLSPEKINAAVAMVAPLLTSAGISLKSTDHVHQQLVGALTDDLQSYMESHNGQMPNEADLQRITQRLLVQGYSGTGGLFFGPPKERLFQAENKFAVDPQTGLTLFSEGKNYVDPNFWVDVPPAATTAINAAFKKQAGRYPTLQELSAIYLKTIGPNDEQIEKQ